MLFQVMNMNVSDRYSSLRDERKHAVSTATIGIGCLLYIMSDIAAGHQVSNHIPLLTATVAVLAFAVVQWIATGHPVRARWRRVDLAVGVVTILFGATRLVTGLVA